MNLTARCSSKAAERGEFALTLPLRHGGEAVATLRYELVGRGERLLLVAGGISAGRHAVASSAFPERGWWQAQASTFDLEGVGLLAIDWLGADGALDLPIDPADQADAIAALLMHLGFARVDGFVGASYGGMVALHFAARHASLCGSILVISAAASAHPFASACRSLQRRALSLGEAAGDPASGVALARAMAMLTYRTPAEFGDRFADPPRIEGGRVRVAADSYLDFHGDRHAGRMSAAAYRGLSESIDLHRIDPASVKAPATFIAVDSDALVPAADVEALAAAVPAARFRLIHSRFGHDAFLKEEAEVAEIVSQYLETLEPKP
jgi:homoserine O-acetyltransferase